MFARAAFRTLLAVLAVASFSSAERAQAFTNIVVFGDSLSDSGALTYLSPASCPAAPYFDCRFSNGPTYAELLAAEYGLTAETAYAGTGGTNYAIGGQRSDEILTGQIPLYSSSVGGVADPNALYIVWGGGNDFLQGLDPVVAANNIVASVNALAAMGATNFLVPNVPVQDAAFGIGFDTALNAGLAGVSGNVYKFETLALLFQALVNPGLFGYTNVTDPCWDGVSACATPETYLFWDDVHPTAVTHQLLSDQMFALVPEPGTALLLGLGLAGLSRLRRTH